MNSDEIAREGPETADLALQKKEGQDDPFVSSFGPSLVASLESRMTVILPLTSIP